MEKLSTIVPNSFPKKCNSFHTFYLPLQKATPACRYACLREATPAKAGTSTCRYGFSRRWMGHVWPTCHGITDSWKFGLTFRIFMGRLIRWLTNLLIWNSSKQTSGAPWSPPCWGRGNAVKQPWPEQKGTFVRNVLKKSVRCPVLGSTALKYHRTW